MRPQQNGGRGLTGWTDRQLGRLAAGYRRQVERSSRYPLVFALCMLGALGASLLLASVVPSELAPAEDRGAFFISIQGPEGAGYDYSVQQIGQVEQALAPLLAMTSPWSASTPACLAALVAARKCTPAPPWPSSRTGASVRKARPR